MIKNEKTVYHYTENYLFMYCIKFYTWNNVIKMK